MEWPSTGLPRGPSSGASPDWHANAGRRPSWVRWPTAVPPAGRGSRRLTMNIDMSVAKSEKSCFRQAPTRTGSAYGGALTRRCRGRHCALVTQCFGRYLGPEHDLKRLLWYSSARAPCANGGEAPRKVHPKLEVGQPKYDRSRLIGQYLRFLLQNMTKIVEEGPSQPCAYTRLKAQNNNIAKKGDSLPLTTRDLFDALTLSVVKAMTTT